MGFQGSCPTCGAPVEFDVANSLLVVCESCSSAVGRGDGKLEDYGKVADLAQTDSPLQVGISGKVKGKFFEVTGRTQYQHAAGGVWDEWYVAFDGGERWGWLAEAQGRYYLTFPRDLPADHAIPSVESLDVEDEIMVPKVGRMVVVEVGQATLISAEGEIPFSFKPGEVNTYADLQGAGKKFATLDESNFYLGGEFPLEKLGIADIESRDDGERTAASVSLNCPNCGGSLDLTAPDHTERVACPFCDSLLGMDEGNLQFLHALKQTKVKPVIPLGSKGELRGREYTIIGFMQRNVRYQGVNYPWTEYLLYTPRKPFHWLVNSENHWTLGKPVSAGDVRAHVRSARYQGKTFKTYDRSIPEVTAVYGEFYWKVELGEKVAATDYIHPPLMLSREETAPIAKKKQQQKPVAAPEINTGGGVPPIVPPIVTDGAVAGSKSSQKQTSSREVNYTLGEYVPVEEVETAFGVSGLKRPTSVAPHQVYQHKSVYPTALALLGAAIVLGLLMFAISPRKQVYVKEFQVSTSDASQEVFSEPFEVRSMRNLRLVCSTAQTSKWAYVDGNFYNEKSGKKTDFSVGIPQNKAGSKRKRVKYMSSLPSGKYTMRLKFQFQKVTSPTQRTVKIAVQQGYPRMRYWFLLMLALVAAPIGVALHQLGFEYKRWESSDFSPFSTE
ncbi:MAG: DUF4178 domain-containing protein [Pirellulaceae bacterium]|nr:DUF4178 domain-containing protein [Pirellulaceae bacterium]MDP7015265.1 DUF4178 domain-containing protein [Pirellulaceae bacterium]